MKNKSQKKVGLILLVTAVMTMLRTATKEAVDKGRNLLYNLDNEFNHETAAPLESFEFRGSKKDPSIAVLHYKLTDGPKKATLACSAVDAGVLVLDKKGQYTYTGKPVVVVKGQLTLAN